MDKISMVLVTGSQECSMRTIIEASSTDGSLSVN